MDFTNQSDGKFVYSIARKNMAETLDQIIIGNKVALTQPSDNKELGINFLPGRNDSRINKPEDFLAQHKTAHPRQCFLLGHYL